MWNTKFCVYSLIYMKIKIKRNPVVLKKNPFCIKTLLISLILLYSQYFNFRFRVNRIVDISHHINRARDSPSLRIQKILIFQQLVFYLCYYFYFKFHVNRTVNIKKIYNLTSYVYIFKNLVFCQGEFPKLCTKNLLYTPSETMS